MRYWQVSNKDHLGKQLKCTCEYDHFEEHVDDILWWNYICLRCGKVHSFKEQLEERTLNANSNQS